MALSLHANRFSLREHTSIDFHAIVPHGDKIEDILKPVYWAHTSANLRPMCHIYVDAEDGSFFAELYVHEAGRNWARVSLLRMNEFGALSVHPAAPDPEFKVEHAGNFHKWRVVRVKDGAVIASKLPSEDAAREALKQHKIVVYA